MIPFTRPLSRCLLLVLALASLPAVAQRAAEPATGDAITVAPVVVDGETLFRLRGTQSFPASERARVIHDRIVALARDREVPVAAGTLVRRDDRITVVFGEHEVVNFLQPDAELEQIKLDLLAEVGLDRIQTAVTEWRAARSARALGIAFGWLLAFTAIAAGLLLLVVKGFGWLDRFAERQAKQRIEQLEKASHRIIDAAQIWSWVAGALRGLKFLAVLVVVLTWLEVSLGLFPWTRPLAASVLQLLLDPLRALGVGFVAALPDLAFLVVLFFVVRFVLRVVKAYFQRVAWGRIHLRNFDRDWAMPTYRILRVGIIAFSLVIAYPYIPGSGSEAFKGVSIFLGVIFSIGSSSFIANIVAGYSLTYRRAFREGDVVKIDEHVGRVIEMRVLNTRLRSVKNEEVNIPNSIVLNSAVINYSRHLKDEGLLLHTEVGIGYDAPWRQVEAMLLMAAERTGGLEKEPPPFVLQKSLGDFAVTYELNAVVRDDSRLWPTRSELHANIQDVFNEHGVQIMSPHYEGDPEHAKVVAREQWHAAPARPPADQGG